MLLNVNECCCTWKKTFLDWNSQQMLTVVHSTSTALSVDLLET